MNIQKSSNHSPELVIGIDGGGTSCRALLVDANFNELGMGQSGAANPYHDYQGTISSILESVEAAVADANLPANILREIDVGAGLAGVNLPKVFSQMQKWDHPFRSFSLTTDLEAACLGAHAGSDGAVMIAGTGSSGCSIVSGEVEILCAFGYPFADTASGAWLGVKAIRAALKARENLGQATLLQNLVQEELGSNGDEIVENLMGAQTRDYAKFANMVFIAATRDDEVAKKIVLEGSSYLNLLAEQLLKTGAPALSFLGGLNELWTPWLAKDISSRFKKPKHAATLGACFFATKLDDTKQDSAHKQAAYPDQVNDSKSSLDTLFV